KFKKKGDEGYFIGYSMSSKAFRVFNKRTRRVKENLPVEFLENKAIEKVTKDTASQEVKKDVSSLRYIALPNWVHEALMESSLSKPQDDCSTDVPKSSGNFNPTATSMNPLADQLETLTVETLIPTISLSVPTACLNDSPEPSSDTRSISKRVANQVETPSLDNILTLTNRFEDILGVTTNSVDSDGVEADVTNMETNITASPTLTLRIHKDHPKSQIISPVDTLIQTKNKSKENALQDPSWVEAMQEELLQFKIQNVWTLVDCPKGVRPIGTKWVLKNKKDERGIVIRFKARLVAQGHTQEEGIDYNKVFTPVARIEAIRLFLAYASFMGFTVYQMDVKSTFLYGTIDEEVYVMQPPRFQDLEFSAKVYKVEKAMYGLHEAPRAWYGTLSKYLLTNGFQRGTIDQTLFIRRKRGDFILVQVYVDDIIFGSSNPQLRREFEAFMHEKFQMSAMGELNFFLGLQVLQKEDGIFLSQNKHQVTPKECHLHAVKRIFRYLKGHPKLGLWYPKESPFDLTIVATSTTEAEYVAAASCCGQVLWIQNQLLDYGHHFIKDCFEKKLISVDHIHTDENVADLLTKPFDAGRFQYLIDTVVNMCMNFLHGSNSEQRTREFIHVYLAFSEHNVDFHPIVDFVEVSPLRYALTFKPTVYVSHIRQFWSAARIETTKEGTKILATVDGILRTVTESSLRRNLKLQDGGKNQQITHTHTYVVPFHTRKLFTTLRVNSPSFSGRIVPFFETMLVSQGEGSGTPTEPHHTPSPKAPPISSTTPSLSTLSSVTTVPIPTVTPSDIPTLRQYTKRARIAQSSALLPVADEPAFSLRDVSQGEACPTDSGFGADQDRANIAKTSTLSHDSAPMVTSPAADEGSMQQTLDELMALCTSLQRQHSEMVSKFKAQELEINMLKARVKLLEDREGEGTERFGDDAPIKGRNLDEGEAAAERVSDDIEEMATILTSMDASIVLASGVAEVSIGSGSIPTAGPPAAEVPTGSDVVPTAGLIFATATVVTPYTRRKGNETMVESKTPKKKKVQEQIDAQVARELEEQTVRENQRMSEQVARDAEIARIHAEEELQITIDGLDRSNETIAKGMTFEEIEAKLTTVWKQIKKFILMGSKEEAERFKRKGIRFEQESGKRLKTSEEVPEEVKSPDEVLEEKALVKESLSIRPPTSDKKMELWVELKRLYEPDDEDQLWTHTQNLMHASVEWKLYDMCEVHQVISKDKEIFMLVEKDYPLRKGLAIGMISYKLQVETYSKMANDLIMKIYKIANSPSQQVMKFPLPEEVPTASEESSHCQKKRDATAVKIALLLKSRRNCQSKSDDSYAKLVPHVTPSKEVRQRSSGNLQYLVEGWRDHQGFHRALQVETRCMKGAPECRQIFRFMHGVNNPELTKRLNEHIPKTMEEMMTATTAFIRGETSAASKRKVHTSWKPQDQPKQHLKKQIEELVRAGKLSHLIKEIKQGRDQSKLRKKEVPAKDKYMEIYMVQPWHRMTRQKVTQSFACVKEIMFPPLATSSGIKGSLVIEAEIGGHMIHRMYVDGGSSTEVLYEHCFNRLRSEIKGQMVPTTTSLTGFSGETIWLMGQLRILVIIGDAEHSTKAWMNFMIVRSLSPYNGIIRRPRIREIQAVPSTAHGVLKFPVDRGIVTIRSTILIPTECAAVTTTSEEIIKEAEVRYENFNKKSGQASKRARAIQVEVQKLVEAWIMIEVYYHDWLSNPVMMAESNEEKMAFHTNHGVYCYTKIPFGLKNAGATYQRLVDKAFDSQVGRNIKVYVDDLVIKSHTETKMLGDIDETFHTLRKSNMKLNTKKWRLQKWSVMLGEHNITHRSRTCVKGQILTNFLIENPDEDPPDTSMVETPQESWTLFTDRLSCVDRSEYEALIAGLRIVAQIGVRNVYMSVDCALSKIAPTSFAHLSKQVLFKVLKEKSIQEKEVAIVVEEDGPTWMTPIMKYLKDGTLSDDRKEASKLHIKARQYKLLEGVLYMRSFLKPWLRCVGPLQADYVIREIHEGSCSMHAGPRSMVAKAIRLGYYLPTMHRDAQDMIRKCNDCQIHRLMPRNPQQPLTPITAPWPFYKWGIDIAGPFSEGPGKVKFLIVDMDYFTKWIEAKAVATITDSQVKKFVWDNIVCRFGLPREILSHNGKQFSDNPFKDWGKLGSKWEGPYEVTEALRDGAYSLRSMDETVFPRTWNIANLKKCYL
nr:putative ribonuclease H-like domain-containing protein [Tanacetum cinerariifolium]